MSTPPTVRRVYRVTGDVQRVGYREQVMGIARRMEVAGKVANLPDDSVEVVCEGTASLLDAFVAAISIRRRLIRVDAVALVEETPAEPGEGRFERVYGPVEEESAERADAAVAHLGILVDDVELLGEKLGEVGEKIDLVGEKVDKVGEKVDRVGEKVDGVGNAVATMHGDMNRQFGDMNTRYDSIGRAATDLVQELRGLRQDLRDRRG